jgi:two-component system response regulator MprA
MDREEDAPVSERMRVLIVEDDARTARTLSQMLEEDGYNVELSFDGASAIARLGRDPAPDALVVDYRLPHVDGMVVARYARSRYPRIPVFVVSSYMEVVAQTPPLDPPAVMLTKPLVYRELTDELARTVRV